MNEEVTTYIHKLQSWQIEVTEGLRTILFKTIPDVEERLQYGKPHYLKNGHYAAVIHASKAKISFMIFNAAAIQDAPGWRSMGNGDRKVFDITEDQEVDYTALAKLLQQASATL
jgi:hypothetical protein